MRKFISALSISILLLLFSQSQSIAQIAKGTNSLGIQQNFTNLLNDGGSSQFTIQAVPGYFVGENFQVSANVGLSTFKQSTFSGEDIRTTSLTLGPRLTYMLPVSENLYLPIVGGYDFSTVLSSSSDVNTSSFTLGVGIEYLINNKLGARYSIFYTNSSFGSGSDNLNLLTGAIGVFLYFPEFPLKK